MIGKRLGRKAQQAGSEADVAALRRGVKLANAANVATNAALGAVTTSLAMRGNRSLRFSLFSRLLP